MKGVVLAGGTGSRLFPLTKVTNKHLLPVGMAPMIWHPLWKLKEAGIEEILIVTGTEHMGDVVALLGSGKDFGCRFTYKVQDEAGGIAQALGLAENFAGGLAHLRDPGRQHLPGQPEARSRSLREAGEGRPHPAEARGGSPALRRGRGEGWPGAGHRGEAQGAQVQPGRDGHLLLRCHRVRHHPHREALGPRRDGDHRREQRLHRQGPAELRHLPGLVDRRGHLPEPGPRQRAGRRGRPPRFPRRNGRS